MATSTGPRRLIVRAVGCPMESTCGFSRVARTRSVGSRSNTGWSEATTQSSSASVASSTATDPVARMFTSIPRGCERLVPAPSAASTSRPCGASRGLAEAVRVDGDREGLVRAGARRRAVSSSVACVHDQVVCECRSPRRSQRARRAPGARLAGGLELTEVLA